MDKSNLPPPSTAAALKALNKASYKISKHSSSSSSSSSIRAPSPPPPPSRLSPPLPAPPPPPSSAPSPIDHPPPQPPVYNIDKSNFRDIVQKLTGSPSHLLPPQPPAAPAASASAGAPPSARPLMAPPPPPPPLSAIPSRLHRIRPPPLAPPRPPPILPAPAPPGQPTLSPLPALPSVCMSAESPISAYMRRLRGMPSPIHVPTSPLGFGCLHSPRAPTSPGVAMPATSPRVRDP